MPDRRLRRMGFIRRAARALGGFSAGELRPGWVLHVFGLHGAGAVREERETAEKIKARVEVVLAEKREN